MNKSIHIYTDGSCDPNPGPGGWAFVALYKNFEMVDSGGLKYTTNNIMEITAVIEAIKFGNEIGTDVELRIFTDSMYVINCATGKWQRKKNIELWKAHDAVAKNRKVSFTWVKAHNGNKYNEIVDKLAKKETEKNKNF